MPKYGRVVRLKGFDPERLFRVVARNGDAGYWATDDPTMSEASREEWDLPRWEVELNHRGQAVPRGRAVPG